MIEYKIGDILKEQAEALVNTVNCVGVMGRGIALQFKKAFPANFTAYADACRKHVVIPGRMFVFSTGFLIDPKYIINFPTKRHWREKSRLVDIEEGLNDLVHVVEQKGISSIAIPPLGCGLGGLDWFTVQQLIEERFSGLKDVHCSVFAPLGAPKRIGIANGENTPTMTPGRAALVALMSQYLRAFLEPYVTLLEVHKLMYFMQAAGERLRLRFVKAHYGPYAENLRHVLNAIEGIYVSGYGDGEDAPDKPLSIMPGAEEKALAVLTQYPETKVRLERVMKLVEGFESSFGLELLASVHWLAVKEDANSTETVVQKMYAWNNRKRQFSHRQITLAVNILRKYGWL